MPVQEPPRVADAPAPVPAPEAPVFAEHPNRSSDDEARLAACEVARKELAEKQHALDAAFRPHTKGGQRRWAPEEVAEVKRLRDGCRE